MFRYFKIAFLGAALLGAAGRVQAEEIVVGGKNFTEQQVLTSITTQYLRAKGYDITDRSGMGSATLRQAMENGQVDIYWEYTGTSLITYNKIKEKLDAQQTYDKVKELDAGKGIVWLKPSQANNTYALAMRADEAERLGIKTISDLASKENGGAKLTLASNAEFYARPDGLKPLEKNYGFDFGRANIKRMDTGLVYQALKDGQVDVGVVFATDGRIPAFDFVTLKDDKGYFPSYALVPVILKKALDAHPDLADLMDAISARLTDTVMAKLNARVDVDKVSVENVAGGFLKENGLI